jgi:hypothetical protein
VRVGRGVLIVVSALGCLGAGGFAAGVLAANGPLGALTTTGTTATATATTTTAPPPPPAVELLARDVWVGRVEVGGLTPRQASVLVQTEFDEPLSIRFARRTVLVAPQRLGASARVREAINRARTARSGTRIPLRINLRVSRVRAYVGALGRRFDRPATDAELVGLRGLRPWITKERTGKALKRRDAVRLLVDALRRHRRAPVLLRAGRVDPAVTRARYGPVVVIRRDSKRLHLYRGMRLWKLFGVATGTSEYPTPIGRFSIVILARHPWWYPPDSDWAKGEKPVPPGPGNPLGTRWMGLSASGVGIHGTPDAASIGYSASHGCIRMRIPEAEWLFSRVRLGTTVFIVRA